MARYLFVLAILSFFNCSALADDPVYILDKNLKAAIEAELGISDPNATDLLELTFLDAIGKNISNLTGLEYATNLQYLWLGNNPFSDISPLEGLMNLLTLDISSSQVNNYSILTNLTNLQELSIQSNQLSDISFLENMSNLQFINLWDNQISDISPLIGLTNLRTLFIGNNLLNNIELLSELNNLETLDLVNNQVSDISVFADMNNIRSLELAGNMISDISVFADMNSIQSLDLSYNMISDISPLMGLKNLQSLSLNDNQISDINPLAGMTQLKGLNLGNNLLESDIVNIISNFTNLEGLSLSNIVLDDIDFLSNFPNLLNIDLGKTQISDISILSNFTNLTSLFLYGNQINDISTLSNLKNISWLELQFNKIFDISPLSELTNLNYLDLNGNNLNFRSYDFYIPIIEENNPYAEIYYDPAPPEPPTQASDPNPENDNNYIPIDVILSWTSGKYADSHDVYFGTSLNDIMTASRSNPLGVLQSQNQISNSYNPGTLERSQTYYWRIDEIQKMPDEVIYQGNIWYFTTVSEPELVAYYPMDEGQGTVVTDGSGNGYDGHGVNGNLEWIEGKEGNAILFTGVGTSFINCGTFNPSEETGQFTVSLWINFVGDYGNYQGIIAKRNTYVAGQVMWALEANDAIPNNLTFSLTASNKPRLYSGYSLPIGTWDHVTVTYNGTNAIMYVNGVEIGRAELQFEGGEDAPVLIGDDEANGDNGFNGAIDEVYIFSTALSPDEIVKVMNGEMKPVHYPGTAKYPQPENKSSEILIDIGKISWASGKYVNTHNVFFGTDFNDVNDATVDYPLGTTVYQDLDTNSISLDNLVYDTTYYWRVDEVNSPLKPAIYMGQVWQFTTESYAQKLPSVNINVTAISSYRGNDPNNTINESGLEPENMDLHSSNYSHMWYSKGNDTEPVWIKYEFDQAYKLYEMYVWNYNNSYLDNCGFRDVKVEYSQDDVNWKELPDTPEFNQAPIADGYQYNTTVVFGGILAKYVRLTANNNWSDSSVPNCGLSEVRFTYIPLQSREPFPAINASDVSLDVTLSWRPGREADLHDIYISIEEESVIHGTSYHETSSQTSFGSLYFDLGHTYYWRVDEVNEAETPSLWQGDIWSFTTKQYLVIDDFEDYNDIKSYRVYDIWSDGRNDPENGSVIGYQDPNVDDGEHYSEMYIQHNGLWSTPITYDNSIANYSEVTVNINDLSIGSDWSKGWPEILVLWFYGDSNNSLTEQMYVKINNQKILYNNNMSDIKLNIWKQWKIDLTTLDIYLSNIKSFSIGFERTCETGGSGIIYIDDIRLYCDEPKDEIWIESESADTIQSPLMIYDDPNSSGSQYIEVINGNNSLEQPPYPIGTASYNFKVNRGKYKVQARIITSPDVDQISSDSCWIRIVGAKVNTIIDLSGWIKWNEMEYGEYWHWDFVHSNDDENKQVEFELESGIYTLEIGYREDGLLIDAILITKID